MMSKRTRYNGLQAILREHKVKNTDIAKALKISTRQVSRLLDKDINDLTIRQLQGILSCTGMTISIYLDQQVY